MRITDVPPRGEAKDFGPDAAPRHLQSAAVYTDSPQSPLLFFAQKKTSENLRLPFDVTVPTGGQGEEVRCDSGRRDMPGSHGPCLFGFVCLFVVIKPENSYFASRFVREVKSLGVYQLGPPSSSCSFTEGTPPPGDTRGAN